MGRAYDVYTIKGLGAALRSLPKEASAELREAALGIVGPIAADARARAAAEGGVAGLVQRSIKGKRDRVPAITMGARTVLPARDGRRRARTPSQTINAVWGGAEFGSDRFRQFGHRWTGRDEHAGLFFYAAIRAGSDDMQRDYSAALLRAMRKL